MKVVNVTDAHDDDVVVFLLGMQMRHPWRVDQWGRIVVAMTRMITELETAKAKVAKGVGEDLGYLGGYTTIGARGPQVTQYWRTVEDLHRYAQGDTFKHRAAWMSYYRRNHQAKSSSVGIWHETFVVPAGAHETIYSNMKAIGLGKATGELPAERRGRSAAERLGVGAS